MRYCVSSAEGSMLTGLKPLSMTEGWFLQGSSAGALKDEIPEQGDAQRTLRDDGFCREDFVLLRSALVKSEDDNTKIIRTA